MRQWLLIAAAVVAASLASPAAAQDDRGSCLAQMATTVAPLLQQASTISPQGLGAAGFAPLAQPFAPPYYSLRYGLAAPPSLAPPTAAYNASAYYTGQAGLPQPQVLSSQAIIGFLSAGNKLDLANPVSPNANPNLILALANLQQTEQARQQQQALLQQQQGLYLNSLYQLSSSYQVTATDWLQAYASLAQAWMAYFRDVCADDGAGLAGLAGGAAPTAAPQPQAPQPLPGQPMAGQPGTVPPGYPAGYVPASPQYPMVPGYQPYPGVPGATWR
jgi:hypothetical protein